MSQQQVKKEAEAKLCDALALTCLIACALVPSLSVTTCFKYLRQVVALSEGLMLLGLCVVLLSWFVAAVFLWSRSHRLRNAPLDDA
jgi:hypothetical protein